MTCPGDAAPAGTCQAPDLLVDSTTETESLHTGTALHDSGGETLAGHWQRVLLRPQAMLVAALERVVGLLDAGLLDVAPILAAGAIVPRANGD